MDILGVERALEEIGTTLHKIFTLLEQHAPQGSERERIALKVYSVNTIGADTAFEYADEWIAERDRQRAKQAE
jgi:hypothetical protein